jgi:hypothetical protein
VIREALHRHRALIAYLLFLTALLMVVTIYQERRREELARIEAVDCERGATIAFNQGVVLDSIIVLSEQVRDFAATEELREAATAVLPALLEARENIPGFTC